jgi:hypothetical protein
MILHVETYKDSTKQLLELIKKIQVVKKHKINKQKSVTFPS